MRAWDEYLLALEKELGKETIERWARSLRVINFNAANLYLEAPDGFAAQWFFEYLFPKASKKFTNENGRLIKIHLQVAQKQTPSQKEKQNAALSDDFQFTADPLDSSNRWDLLVRTSQNKIVFKLFEEFKRFKAGSPALYNPIYIYGPSGMGKTHLLQAIATLLVEKKQRALYVKLPTFMHNMVSAMKAAKMSEFRSFYRSYDVLLVDDVDQLAQKATTQEEFFHTFNALHTQSKQIILSSKCSPQQLEDIEPRLVSRFEWGIVLPIKVPSNKELEKVLQQKLKDVQIELNTQAKAFLMEHFSHSPKVLAKAVNALVLRAHLKLPQGHSLAMKDLTPIEIQRLLSDLIQKQKKASMTVEHILEQIAKYFGVSTEEILGKSQSRECVLPRQISMFFCRELLQLPYMKIGRIFSRDHSTVMSSVKQVQKRQQSSLNDTQKVIGHLREGISKSLN